MKRNTPTVRCAIYTRKSTDDGLEQQFNSLDAQRQSAESYVQSQVNEGWVCLPDRYDDGGFSGGTVDRPALQRLLKDIEAGYIDCVVVYKVDRLSRSLMDFSRVMQQFEKFNVSFVSVTQQFNTSDSMGRLTMNMLLSFAQFERELVSERTRDKIAATRRKGMWTGGRSVLGYDIDRSTGNQRLDINEDEAHRVREIFRLYIEHKSMLEVVKVLRDRGWRTKRWVSKRGRVSGDAEFDKGKMYQLLTNPIYTGRLRYNNELYDGLHDAIIEDDTWNAAQAILSRNGSTGGASVRNKHGAMLRGLLRCAPCDVGMSHSYTRKGNVLYRYYRCQRASVSGHDCCPHPSVSASKIEQFVVERIRCVGRDPQVVAQTTIEAQRETKREMEATQAEQRIVQRELRQLHTDLRGARDAGHQANLHERIEKVNRRLEQLQNELDRLSGLLIDPDSVQQALAQFDDVWDALTGKEREQLIALLVEKVVYDGEKGTIRITFHPTGIQTLITDNLAQSEEIAA